ncbi:MAG: hypothetical protein ACRCYY_13385 [Trueperaceae bacterium]
MARQHFREASCRRAFCKKVWLKKQHHRISSHMTWHQPLEGEISSPSRGWSTLLWLVQ